MKNPVYFTVNKQIIKEENKYNKKDVLYWAEHHSIFGLTFFWKKKNFRLGSESGQYFYPFSNGEAFIWSVCFL